MAGSPGPRASQVRRLAVGALLALVVLAVSLLAADRFGLLGRRSALAAASAAPTQPLQSTVTATLGPTPSPTATPLPTPAPTPTLVPAPLTGLPVLEAAAIRHPIAVMIDDQVDARPQAGFNAAAVVWQAPAEGGVPRYMLVFQDQVPGLVGPVRSARQYYVEWAAELEAMYVHHGGSPQALATLRARGRGDYVWNADGFRWEGTYLWRVRERASPHNLYTDGDHLLEMAAAVGAKDGPVEPIWAFGTELVRERRPNGGEIIVHYPTERIAFRYDPGTNSYPRYINGATKPQVDAADGRIVAPRNVVLLRMSFGPLDDGNPAKKRLEADNVGSGEAWIATNGRTIKGRWKKDSITGATRLYDLAGRPVVLTAGQTFVQVLARSYGYQIKDEPPPTSKERRLLREW